MRKLLLLFLVSNLTYSYAQYYTPFPDSNAVWVNGQYGVDWSGEIPEYVLYQVTNYCMTTEDTTINATVYSKLFICGSGYVGALRDNGGQVYFVPKDSLDEFLVYDFTVVEGQVLNGVIYTGNFMDYTIGQIDSIIIGGTYRTRIHVGQGYWIEGIGCTMGLFNDPYGDFDGMQDLLCMSVGDTSFYPTYGFGYCPMDLGFNEAELRDDQLLSYPNPTTGLVLVNRQLDEAIDQLFVTNHMGQKMEVTLLSKDAQTQIDLSALPSGIYLLHIFSGDQYFSQKIVKE